MKENKLNKTDWIIMGIMMFLYGILSFIRLGDTVAPQTYKTYSISDEWAVVTLKEESEISKIRYYTGNNLGKINILKSDDGINYEYVDSIEINSVFSWQDLSVSMKAKKIAFVATEALSTLGDVGLFDKDDNIIPIVVDYNNPLTDETNLVPKEISYMNSTYFDEIYYARTVYEYINGIDCYEWTHPPFGKLIMSIPVLLFGFSPFNYRLMGNIFGILLIPIMYILAKSIFKNRKWATVAALLMMFDNFHFVHTRIALIDGFQVVFILLSVLFMKKYLDLERKDSFKKKTKFLLLSGLFIGMAIATKWNALYAGLGLAIVFFINLFKRYKIKDKELIKLALVCTLSFIILPVVIYILSYVLFPTVSYYDGSIKGIIDMTDMMYNYHANLDATHPFTSSWYEWPIMYKPVWFFVGNSLSGLKMTITDIGNPIIWWSGIISFIYLIISLFKKNKDNLFIIIFILSTFLPYIFVGRVMFMYHYFITLPFVMLGITAFVKWITEKTKSNIVLYSFITVVIIVFILFYPIVSGMPVSEGYIGSLTWLSSWYF